MPWCIPLRKHCSKKSIHNVLWEEMHMKLHNLFIQGFIMVQKWAKTNLTWGRGEWCTNQNRNWQINPTLYLLILASPQIHDAVAEGDNLKIVLNVGISLVLSVLLLADPLWQGSPNPQTMAYYQAVVRSEPGHVSGGQAHMGAQFHLCKWLALALTCAAQFMQAARACTWAKRAVCAHMHTPTSHTELSPLLPHAGPPS